VSSSLSVAPTSVTERGSWRWCAENYLNNLWWKMDRQFIQQFSGTVTCTILDELCRKYSVARTIPGMLINKYQPLADALNRQARTVFTRGVAAQRTILTRDDVPLVVEQELTALFRAYGKDPLSALTKGLWMMKQHPVVIYDSMAYKGMTQAGLRPGYRYQSYYDAWFEFFERPENQSALDDSVAWAPTCASAARLIAAQKISAQSLSDFIGSPAFRNRVLDRWLTFKGGATNW
jgi:hypothetical protein